MPSSFDVDWIGPGTHDVDELFEVRLYDFQFLYPSPPSPPSRSHSKAVGAADVAAHARRVSIVPLSPGASTFPRQRDAGRAADAQGLGGGAPARPGSTTSSRPARA